MMCVQPLQQQQSSAMQSPPPSADQAPIYVKSPTPPPPSTGASPVEYFTTPQAPAATVQPIISEGIYNPNTGGVQFGNTTATPQAVRTIQCAPLRTHSPSEMKKKCALDIQTLQHDADKYAVQSQMDLLSDEGMVISCCWCVF